jgi:hypothetical protein
MTTHQAQQDQGPSLPETEVQVEAPTDERMDGRPSPRAQTKVKRLIEVMVTEMEINTRDNILTKIFCLEAMFPEPINQPGSPYHCPLMAYKATADPDTMYLHQANERTRLGTIHTGNAKRNDGSDGEW